MATRSFPLVINQGADYELTIPVLNAAGSPSSVAGWTAHGQIRRSAADATVLYEFTLDVETTTVVLRVPALHSSSWTFRTGRYDIEITAPDGVSTSRLIDGPVVVRPETTRLGSGTPWEPPPTGGFTLRGASDYDDDVAPATGQAIVWDGEKYAPGTVSGGGGGGSVEDATTSIKGVARLLGGTADAPSVPWTSVTGKPAIPDSPDDIGAQPAGSYATTTQLSSGLAGKADTSSLAPVATSGAYVDLTGRPTVPTQYSDLTGSVPDAAIPAAIARDSEVTSAISTHTAAADPHGDRGVAAAALSAHEADTTGVHGIADTSALETTTGSAAKVATHVAASDPHGDRAYADGLATPDATTSVKGKAVLLGGTAANPTVPWSAVTGKPDLSGATGYQGSIATAAVTMYARYATRDVSPVPIVVLGSSTAGGQGATNDARQMMNRWIIGVQTDHPLSSGSAQPSVQTLTSSMTLSNGIQHLKGAESGSNSGDYMDSTKVAQVAAINPAVVAHLVGSNDYSININPATTYKNNIAGWLDALDAAITVPHVHLLIHGHRRTNVSNPTYAWSAYGTALKDLAEARANCVFVDLSTAFHAAGQDTTDPHGMRNADNIHLTDKGHAFGADVLRAALRLTAPLPSAFTPAADPSTPALTNSVAPAISGTATTGQTLTVSNGTWSATPDSYTYQWKRAGSNISGATSSTYVLQVADEGQAITCTVTAAKSGYTSGSATSNSVTPSAGGSPSLTNSVAPAITGTATTGQTLTASTGTWNATPDSYAYQWKRAGTNISGATSSTYVVAAADVGQALTVAVTASKAGYTSGSATSSSVTPVAGTFTNSTIPTISGTATTGSTLTAGNGTWSVTPDSYTYVWKRAGSAISGATAQTYVLQVADEGQAVTVTVTAVKAGYTSVSATSDSVTPTSGGSSDYTTGLIFDFDADSVTGVADGSNVTSWTSQGGSAGALALSQSSTGPVYKAAQLNGHAALRFASSVPNRVINVSNPTVSLTSGATYVYVIKRTGAWSRAVGGGGSSNYHTLFDTGSASGIMFGVEALSGNILSYQVSVLNRWIVVIAVANGASSKMVIVAANGSVESTVNGTLNTSNGVGCSVGGSGSGSGYATFDLAKYRCYDHAFTDTEVTTLRNYLNSRYALS